MSAHSPGPWFVHPVFQTSVMNSVADVAEASVANPHRFANARLIAAAPELLEALREVCLDGGLLALHKARALIRRIEGTP